MSVSERAIHIGVLLSALAVCGWVFGVHRAVPRAPAADSTGEVVAPQSAVLSIIPPGSAFVLTADVRQLQRAPLGEVLAQRVGHVGGAAELAQLCGFDPLARLDQLALAVPSAGLAAQEHPEDFGIVAEGRFTADEIVRCARAVVTQRGGDPIETHFGKFRSVRDRKASAEVAANDGLLLVSGGSYFRELLDAAEGQGSLRKDARDAQHAELRRRLGPGAIVATWLLGEHWFERVAGQDGNARLSPLGTLQAVGAHIDVSETAHVLLLLDCADSEGASRIKSLLGELRASLHALPLDPALSGLAERVSVSQTGAQLTLVVDPTPSELTALLGSLLGP
ncbi:MAG: hypothetical protein ABW061_12210 [Polyangiaceae bacterium]